MSVSIRLAGAAETATGKKLTPGNYCFVRIRTQEFVAADEFSANRSETLTSQIESASLTGQDQERGLERILGVVLVVQPVPAHAPDQPAVPAQQRRERGLVALADEALEQLAVGLPGGWISEPLNVPQNGADLCASHDSPPPPKHPP